MSTNNRNEGPKFGFSPAEFAAVISGGLFACFLISTIVIAASGYDTQGARLCSFWTAGSGMLFWLCLLLSGGRKQ